MLINKTLKVKIEMTPEMVTEYIKECVKNNNIKELLDVLSKLTLKEAEDIITEMSDSSAELLMMLCMQKVMEEYPDNYREIITRLINTMDGTNNKNVKTQSKSVEKPSMEKDKCKNMTVKDDKKQHEEPKKDFTSPYYSVGDRVTIRTQKASNSFMFPTYFASVRSGVIKAIGNDFVIVKYDDIIAFLESEQRFDRKEFESNIGSSVIIRRVRKE